MMVKCKRISFFFTFLQDVTLLGKNPERSFLGVSTPGISPRLPATCAVLLDYLECNISTGVIFSGKDTFRVHLHPAFEASLLRENPKCFERKIFFQYLVSKGTYASQQRKLYWRVFSYESKLLNNEKLMNNETHFDLNERT